MKTEKKPSPVLIINPLQLQAAKILSGVNKQLSIEKLERVDGNPRRYEIAWLHNSSVLKWSLIEGEEGPEETWPSLELDRTLACRGGELKKTKQKKQQQKKDLHYSKKHHEVSSDTITAGQVPSAKEKYQATFQTQKN